MKKVLPILILSFFFSLKSFALSPLAGTFGTCVGSTAYIYESDTVLTGGTWSSSNTAVATVALYYGASATVTGIAAGTATITYTYGGSYVTATFTVSPAPSAITGTTSLCAGATTTLSDAVPGGSWSSSDPARATIGSATGIVTGVSGGSVSIYYTVGIGCNITTSVLVNATYAGSISGASIVCLGGTTTLVSTDTTSSGAWSSSNTSIATVGTTGIVTGVALGTVTISYTATGICGTATATTTVNVVNTTTPPVISGPSTIDIGATATFGSYPGGTWSSSSPSIATIGSLTGLATGVALGTDVITCTIFGCGGLATSTATVNVVSFNGISGHVLFPGMSYMGTVEVWLIHFDPITNLLTAIDSTTIYGGGAGSVYYQFLGAATDSFRIKAALAPNDSTVTGYIPTYHTSNFYWHDANVLWHTSGTADINQDINMAYGTVTTGVGFIAGDVTTGANKGTSGTIPSLNMHVCVVNSATLQVIQQTYTNSLGHYAFSNLPVGQTYYVFPDSLNYLTTAYTSITLTTANPSMTAASFGQHTLSKTILPITSGIKNVNPAISSVIAFPNPTNGKLNIQWNESATEKANVNITDITGRVVYSSAVDMNQGSGVSQLDLSGLTSGVYMMSIKSGTINYNNKIELQK